MSNETSSQHTARTEPTKPLPKDDQGRSSRWPRRLLFTAAGLVILLLIAPWIVAVTPLRNVVINSILGGGGVEASTDSASFSWFSSVELNSLELNRSNGSMLTRVDEVRVEKTLLGLLTSGGDLGRVTINEPTVQLFTDRLEAQPERKPGKATLIAEVNNARVTIARDASESPILDLSEIDVTAEIRREESGRVLEIESLTIFDHKKLTPELCSQGLQLIAPFLDENTNVEGELSLSLDKLHMQLDQRDKQRALEQLELSGSVALHNVSASVKNPLWNRIFGLISGILGRDIPTNVKVVDETTVAFDVKGGRIHHDGMAFIIPELSPEFTIQTSGSVGFDESLDLAVNLHIPFDALHDGPLARRLSDRVFEVLITGTFDQPQISLPENRTWLQELASAVSDDSVGAADGELVPLAGEIMNMLDGLVQQGNAGEPSLASQMAERWRERRRAAAERRAAEVERNGGTPPRRRLFPRLRDRQPINEPN